MKATPFYELMGNYDSLCRPWDLNPHGVATNGF